MHEHAHIFEISDTWICTWKLLVGGGIVAESVVGYKENTGKL